MIPITPIGLTHQARFIQPEQAGVSAKKPAGQNLFERILTNANQGQQASDQAIRDLVAGDTDSIQQVVMSIAKAEMSFELFMEIRNKLIDSYNELMRMQF